MKILITGGAGFIGSHIAETLVDRGDDVVIVDNLISGTRENLPRGARFYRADYGNFSAISRIFRIEKPEAVFHLAAHISVRESKLRPLFYVKEDILGSIRFIEVAKRYGVKKFIFSSTGGAMYDEADTLPIPESALPEPSSPYAMSKFFIERYLFSSGIPSAVLRYANVYGPRQNPRGEAGVIAIFSEKILRGERPIIHNAGITTRDYIFVSDIVAANIAALENEHILGVYNIGTGRETDVNQIFSLLNKRFDSALDPIYLETPVEEVRRSALSSEKFQKISGWRPTVSLEEGIPRVVEWFKQEQSDSLQRSHWRILRFAHWPSFLADLLK